MARADLDARAILAELGVEPIAEPRPVSGGWDTAIWRVETRDGAWALRVFRPEQAQVAEREMAAMRLAGAAGLPVPRVERHGVWRERPALLLSWCAGEPLAASLRRRPWQVWQLSRRFGAAHARMHAVVAPELPSWLDWGGQPEAGIARAVEAARPRPDRLVHLDYHPLNVMVDAGGISAVLDWANARAGDPRADLARTTAILRLAPASPGLTGRVEHALRRLLEEGWRRGYTLAAGWPGDLAPFHAWAGDAMYRDLAPKLGRPGIPLTEADLDRIRGWTARWRAASA